MNENLRVGLCEVETLIAVGSYAVAIGALLELAKEDLMPPHWFELCYKASGGLDQLENMHEAAVEWTTAYPNDAQGHFALAVSLATFERINESEAALHRAIEIERNDGEYWGLLGKCLAAQEKFDEATKAFEIGQAAAKKQEWSYYHRATLLASAENWTGAMDLLTRAINIRSSFAEAYSQAAHIAIALNDESSASGFFHSAVLHDEMAREMYFQDLGLFLTSYNVNTEYLDEMKRLQKNAPDDLNMLYLLGIANEVLDNPQLAEEIYRQVVLKERTHKRAWIRLANLARRRRSQYGSLRAYRAVFDIYQKQNHETTTYELSIAS
jgi:tetratricopeptide (TPR) repeat protein